MSTFVSMMYVQAQGAIFLSLHHHVYTVLSDVYCIPFHGQEEVTVVVSTEARLSSHSSGHSAQGCLLPV